MTAFVRHRLHGFIGVTEGTTRKKESFECPNDREEIRVRLYDGCIKVASPTNLIEFTADDAESAVQAAMLRNPLEIRDLINEGRIPDEWLVVRRGYLFFCDVRGKCGGVDEQAWAKLCSRHGFFCPYGKTRVKSRDS